MKYENWICKQRLKGNKMVTHTTTSRYRGITHALPRFLLNPWKKFMCKKDVHVFDEVISIPREHYLICDACGLIVNIENIDESWVK